MRAPAAAALGALLLLSGAAYVMFGGLALTPAGGIATPLTRAPGSRPASQLAQQAAAEPERRAAGTGRAAGMAPPPVPAAPPATGARREPAPAAAPAPQTAPSTSTAQTRARCWWRQLHGCRMNGARELAGDKDCEQKVPAQTAGYCECGWADVPPLRFACGHAEWTCADVCAQYQRELLAPSQATSSRALVPKNIFQIWEKPVVPLVFAQCMVDLLALQTQGWHYTLVTYEDRDRMVHEHFPWFQSTYQQLTKDVMKADVVRYMYLFMHGGIYLDLDVSLQPLFLRTADAVFGNASVPPGEPIPCQCIIGTEPLEHATLLSNYDTTRFLCNAILVSAPRHPFWLHVLHTIEQLALDPAIDHNDPVPLTGPMMIVKALASFQHAATHPVCVAEPDTFFPKFDADAPWFLDQVRRRCSAPKPAVMPLPTDEPRGFRAFTNQDNFRTLPPPAELLSTRARVCSDLAAHNYRNSPERLARAVTVHHWVHSWLMGVQGPFCSLAIDSAGRWAFDPGAPPACLERRPAP